VIALLNHLGGLMLALVAGFSAAWAFQRRADIPHASSWLSAWALSMLFVALASIANLLPEPGGDLQVIKRMVDNLALFVALPFLGVSIPALAKRCFWSSGGWGRLLLGLFAGFELTRQLGHGETYLLILAACCTVLLIAGSLLMQTRQAQGLGLLSGIFAATAFSLASPFAPFEYSQSALFGLVTATLALVSLAVRTELSQVKASQ